MSNYKFYIQESEPGGVYAAGTLDAFRFKDPLPPHYYVRATGRTLKVFGPRFDNLDDAFAQLRKCEQDEEYAYWQSVYSLGFRPNPREDTRNMTDMTKTEKHVLDYLFENFDGDYCVQTFRSLSCSLGITERQAKTACRRLKRRGYAEHSAYWDWGGKIAGSGYTISREGIWLSRRWRVLEAISVAQGSPGVAESAQSR